MRAVLAVALALGVVKAMPVTLQSRFMSKVGRQEWLQNHTVVEWSVSRPARSRHLLSAGSAPGTLPKRQSWWSTCGTSTGVTPPLRALARSPCP